MSNFRLGIVIWGIDNPNGAGSDVPPGRNDNTYNCHSRPETADSRIPEGQRGTDDDDTQAARDSSNYGDIRKPVGPNGSGNAGIPDGGPQNPPSRGSPGRAGNNFFCTFYVQIEEFFIFLQEQ